MRKGFTLVELLVIVAMTAIVEAIFYPVASKAIGKGAEGFGYFLYLIGLAPVFVPMFMQIKDDLRQRPRVMQQPAPQKGFTLLNLLVVIAVLAILSAILFPVFAQ